MSSNLYEVLEVPHDATVEQIRKAYKKKALKTHPDRLPPTATPEDKARSEEQFRIVNNAYEVLSNAENRRLYDIHGIWPPPVAPQEPLHRSSGMHHHDRHRRHTSPTSHWQNSAFPTFTFTDPFTLFERMFGDLHTIHTAANYYHSQAHSRSPMQNHFEALRFHNEINDLMDTIGRSPFSNYPRDFPGQPQRFSNSNANISTVESVSLHGSGNRWAKESRVTTVVNGVQESIWKRTDWEGNEHVSRTYPDGRETLHINGVEQPSARGDRGQGYISNVPQQQHNHRHQTLPPPHHSHHSPAGSPTDYMPPPPPYPGTYAPPPIAPQYEPHRDRSYSDAGPVLPNFGRHREHSYDATPIVPDMSRHQDRSHKKRWWRGGWN